MLVKAAKQHWSWPEFKSFARFFFSFAIADTALMEVTHNAINAPLSWHIVFGLSIKITATFIKFLGVYWGVIKEEKTISKP